jgi:phytoene dehydrogenase-like protein
MSHYDVVIIGSGHNGLIAANYLLAAGLRVLVLEAAAEFGGATQSQRVFPDFDARLSRYSYLISLLPQKILQDLGIDFRVLRRRIASYTDVRDEAGQHRGLVISNEDGRLSRESMVALCGDDRDWQGYQRFQAMCGAAAEIFWPSVLEPLRSRGDFAGSLRNASQREAWRAFVEEPLGVAIERHVQHDAVRGLLVTDGKIGVHTHARDRSLLQNRCFLYHVVGNGDGQWAVPRGGMGGLVESLLRGIRSRGGALRSAARATAVSSAGAEYEIEYCEADRSHRVAARFVLVNASEGVLRRLTGQPQRRLSADEGSVAKVNMLLRRLPRLRSGVAPEDAWTGSFHVDEGYAAMERSYQESAAGRLPERPPLEVYCHTLTDPTILSESLRRAGYHTLTLFGLDIPYRLFVEQPAATREELQRRYLAGLDRVCAEPFEDCLARDRVGAPCLEIKSPLDLEQELGLDQGNIFHTAPSWLFTDNAEEAGSWGVATGLPRIYRAGSSAVRGGAVSGIPGHAAARQVFADLGIDG